MRLIIISMAILCFSCISGNEDRNPEINFKANSTTGEVLLYVLTTDYSQNRVIDSLVIHLPKDGTTINQKWKPNLGTGDGHIICGLVDNKDIRDTVAYYRVSYPGAMIHRDFTITTYLDKISVQADNFK